jgi:hypothetical protein
MAPICTPPNLEFGLAAAINLLTGSVAKAILPISRLV